MSVNQRLRSWPVAVTLPDAFIEQGACATRGVIDSMACDETTGHVECACGYVGREIKACWLREDAAKHLGIDVETFKAREAVDHPSVRFARRARMFGWDYWGDQSLGTATMGGVARC